jgi:hypothetical protein
MQVVYYGLLLGKLLMGGVKHQNTGGLLWFIEKKTHCILDHRSFSCSLDDRDFFWGEP